MDGYRANLPDTVRGVKADGLKGAKPAMTDTTADKLHDPGKGRATVMTCGSAHALHDGLHDALYVLLPLWSQAFGLSLLQVGILKAAYSGSMAVFQLPAGFLAERFGERALLAVGTVIAALSYVLLGVAGGFTALFVLLLLAGFGSGAQHPLSSSMVARAYENGPRRAALGIYNFSGDIGKVVFPAAVALAAGWAGWRAGTIAVGAIGVAAGLVIYLALRRLGAGSMPDMPPETSKAKVRGWGIQNRLGFQAIGAINVVDTVATYGFLTFMPFLLIEKGAGVETVGFAVALVFCGSAAGKFLCGFTAERIGIIRTVVLTEILTGVGFISVLFMPLEAIVILLPLIGVAMNGTSSVLYASVADYVAQDRHSRAFGLFYTLGIGAGALAPPVFGLVSDMAGVPVAIAAIGLTAFFTLPFCVLLVWSGKAEKN